MSDDDNIRWGHSMDRESEGWSGSFLTREDAVMDGRAAYSGEDFYVCSGQALRTTDLMPDADEIVELMAERAADECGEVTDNFPSVTEAARVVLDTLLAQWAEEYVGCSLWVADGEVERISLATERGER